MARRSRAYALSGENTKAKSDYQDFLTLWNNADLDSAILKQARAEYAKLQLLLMSGNSPSLSATVH